MILEPGLPVNSHIASSASEASLPVAVSAIARKPWKRALYLPASSPVCGNSQQRPRHVGASGVVQAMR